MAMEKEYRCDPSDFRKYTSNLNSIVPEEGLDEASALCRSVAVAFQHYSPSITDGYLMV
jgi:hypothetical protein